jgi:translation initiation factor 2 beta subunit (eIF-2beta)/eIF-5
MRVKLTTATGFVCFIETAHLWSLHWHDEGKYTIINSFHGAPIAIKGTPEEVVEELERQLETATEEERDDQLC